MKLFLKKYDFSAMTCLLPDAHGSLKPDFWKISKLSLTPHYVIFRIKVGNVPCHHCARVVNDKQ
jgi:hypothetical protein